MYEKELKALRRAGRFREPLMHNNKCIDMASNDYLGLSEKRSLLNKACKKVSKYKEHASKSSLFVGGYHPIHRDFEKALCKANRFEAGVVAGSGFLANIGMIEALARRGDTLFIDESYHASGMIAAKLVQANVVTFAHNDPDDLIEKISVSSKGRRIIAVEGIYSMQADRLKREFFDIAEWFDALLIVDEAHSSGTIGPNLLGIFDYYGITPSSRHIKMGTLGKAYGSYGAYILASNEIISFLHNRAKTLIYATAPSLLDISLAHAGFEYISKKREKFTKKIDSLKKVVYEKISILPQGSIVSLPMRDIKETLFVKDLLQKEGFEVGAIRPPTVKKPILRIILRANVSKKAYEKLFDSIKKRVNG